jgi:cytochrome b
MTLQKILVWDAPVRVFHGCLALSFAGAWLTAEADGWRLVHVSLGATVAALVLLRLLWGVVGTRYARFGDFVRGPRAVLAYLRALWAGRAPRVIGHNPLGAVAVLGLLALGLLAPLSGWAALNAWGGEALEEIHETVGNAMALLVVLHIAGVALASVLHREKLLSAMVTGMKMGEPAQAIRRSWRPLALLLLAAVLAFWALQWRAADQGGLLQGQRVLAAEQDRDKDSKEEGEDD